MRRIISTALVAMWVAAPLGALDSTLGNLVVTPVATDLEEPWAVGFLPGGEVLVTERAGRLLLLRGGDRVEVSGVPEVAELGQGGLLDVMVPRDFAESGEIFLSFAKPQGRSAGTALVKAKLDVAGAKLDNVELLFEMTPGSIGGQHFGSRIVEAPDGAIFLTMGERGDRPSAQDLRRENGSVIRIMRDGSVPEDNPFVGQPDTQPEIWSYGHRNPQGAALDLNGDLVTVEHGAQGGDEVNWITAGANYGWPLISYGRHYSGAAIGIGTEAKGMEQPAFYWDPSIAPSGLMVYSGALWPEWTGNLFVGSLKFDYISRLEGAPLEEVEQLQSGETLRVRDVREAPDGSIWFLSVGQGTLYRVTPE